MNTQEFYIDGQPKPIFDTIELDLDETMIESLLKTYIKYNWFITLDKDVDYKTASSILLDIVLVDGINIHLNYLTSSERQSVVSTFIIKHLSEPSVEIFRKLRTEETGLSSALSKSVINDLILEALRAYKEA